MGNCINKKINNEEKELKKCDDSIPKFSLKGKILKSKIVRVYDGDTFWACFFLDNKIVKYNCRCLGYDSPEMRPKNKSDDEKIKEKEAAQKAKDHFIKLCESREELVTLKCENFDKYGRLLVEVYGDDKIVSVNQKMINDGHGYEYDGGTKKNITYNIK